MNSTWQKYWPETVLGQDFEGLKSEIAFMATEDTAVTGDVFFRKSMVIEVKTEDISKLVEDHSAEITS